MDISTIGIEFRTEGLVKGTAALKENERQAGRTADAADRTGAAAKRASDSFSSMGNVLRGLGVGLVLREFIQLSDQYTKYTAQLKLATQSTQEYNKANSEVQRIAKLTEGGLGTIGVLYARITNATRELGVSQAQVSKVSETVGLSLKVAGATAAESSSAMLQLSQAFGAGALRGEEFNAVNEASPGLLRILADSMGVSQGALKKLAEEGKLTTDVLLKAFTDDRVLAGLREQGEQVRTISGAFTLLKDQLILFVGSQNEATGAGAALASAIGIVAKNLDLIAAAAAGFVTLKIAEVFAGIGVRAAGAVTSLAGYIAAQQAQRAATIAAAQAEVVATQATAARLAVTEAALVISRQESIAQLASANAAIAASSAQIAAAKSAGALSFALATLRQGEVALTAAMAARSAATAELAILGQQQARVSAQIAAANTAQAASQVALNAATTAGGVAAGLGARALGLLGGPIGAIATVLSLGVTAWLAWGGSAKKQSEDATAAVTGEAVGLLASLDEQIRKLKERNALAAGGAPNGFDVSPNQEKILQLQARFVELSRETGKSEAEEIIRKRQLQTLGEELAPILSRQNTLLEEQAIAQKNANGEAAKVEYKKYATDAQKLAAELERVKNALGGSIPADLEKRIRASFNKGAVKDFNKELEAQANLLAELSGVNADYAEELKRLVVIRKDGKVTESEYVALVEKLIAKQPSSIKLTKEQADAEKDRVQALESLFEANAKIVQQYEASADSLGDQNKALREEIELIGLTERAQLAILQARNETIILTKEATLAELERASAITGTQTRIEIALKEEIRLLRERGELLGQKLDRTESAKTYENLQAEGKKFAEDLERGLTDSLFRAFEAGRGFFSTLWDGIKNLFKTTVLKAIIQPVVGGTLAGLGLGTANAGTGGGSVESTIANSVIGQGIKSAIGSITIAGSSIAAIGSSVITGIQAGFAGTNLAAAISAYSAAGQAGVAAGLSAGSSIGATAAAAGPYVLAAVAALNALGVFRSNKIVDGGISGTLGGQVNDYALNRRGGTLFSGPSYSVRDQGVSAQNDALQNAYNAIRTTVAGMAEQLGIGNDAIKAFTVQLGNDLIHPDTGGFGIKTQGLTQDEIIKKIEAALLSANEQLAAFALGTTEFTRDGETAVQTLGRLASSLQSVNGVFSSLDLTLVSASLAGADAASAFIDLFGGLENFAQVSAGYYNNFFSEAERTANTVNALAGGLSGLANSQQLASGAGAELAARIQALAAQLTDADGATDVTRAQLRGLIEDSRALGDGFLPTTAGLLQLSEAFASVVPPTQALTEAATETAAAVEIVTEAFQSANVSLGSNFFTPVVEGFQSLLDGMNADIAAANAQIAGTVSNTYQDALDAIQQRADTLQAQLAPGYAANIQNQLDQATYGRSLAQANLRYLQNVGDEVNAVFQQDRIANFTAEIERLTNAMQAGPDIQAFIDSQIALLDFQNGQKATDLITGLNEAILDLTRTDAERRLAALTKQYDDYIKQLTDLNQLTPDNISAVNAWRDAMVAAGQSAVEVTNQINAALARSAQDFGDRFRTEQQLIDVSFGRIAEQLNAAFGGSAANVNPLTDRLRGFGRADIQAQVEAALADATLSDAMRQAAIDAGNALLDLIDRQERLAQSTDTVTTAVNDNNTALQDALALQKLIADERLGLERQLLEAQGNTAAINALNRAAINETNRALYDQVQAQLAANAAAQALSEAERKRTDERLGLEGRLLQLQGDTVEIRRRELEALDPTNRALLEQIYALEDQTAAQEALTQAQQEATSRITEAEDALRNAYRTQADELQQVIDKQKEYAKTIRDYRLGLDTSANALLSPEAQYAAARQALQAASPEDFTRLAGEFLDASRGFNASSAAYFADLEAVKLLAQNAEIDALATADVSQLQLTALEAQVSALITINESVLSVEQAIAALAAARGTPIPGFASGGDFGGGLRMVGERGPELEVTGPARIFSASQTRQIMSGDGGETAKEVKELRGTMVQMGRMMQAMQTRLIELTQAGNEQRDKANTLAKRGTQKDVP